MRFLWIPLLLRMINTEWSIRYLAGWTLMKDFLTTFIFHILLLFEPLYVLIRFIWPQGQPLSNFYKIVLCWSSCWGMSTFTDVAFICDARWNRSRQPFQPSNIQAHSFFKGFSRGLSLVALTREAIVPYLVAVITSTHSQHSYILYSSHIPQALRF